MAKPNLKIVTDEPAFEPPADKPYRRETAAEIALRLRSGMGPTRPIVVRCLNRPKDGEEVWI